MPAASKKTPSVNIALVIIRDYSVSRIFSSCGGRTISHGPRPLLTQESRALRIEFIITKKDK